MISSPSSGIKHQVTILAEVGMDLQSRDDDNDLRPREGSPQACGVLPSLLLAADNVGFAH
jgi:hypothetical protein